MPKEVIEPSSRLGEREERIAVKLPNGGLAPANYSSEHAAQIAELDRKIAELVDPHEAAIRAEAERVRRVELLRAEKELLEKDHRDAPIRAQVSKLLAVKEQLEAAWVPAATRMRESLIRCLEEIREVFAEHSVIEHVERELVALRRAHPDLVEKVKPSPSCFYHNAIAALESNCGPANAARQERFGQDHTRERAFRRARLVELGLDPGPLLWSELPRPEVIDLAPATPIGSQEATVAAEQEEQ